MGIEPVDESEASAALTEEPVLHEAGTQVAVKVEKAEQCSGPESGSLSEQEEFGSDCLSLAQSRLLEDWRPESLQLQSCQSNAYTSPVSNTLGKYRCNAHMPSPNQKTLEETAYVHKQEQYKMESLNKNTVETLKK